MWDSRAETRTRWVRIAYSIVFLPVLSSLSAFIKSLETQGWDVDTQLEHPSLSMGPPFEDLNVIPEEREENIASQLKESADAKRALILKVSHIGGHKYAGNCIVSCLLHSNFIFSWLLIPSILGRSIHLRDLESGMAESLHTMWIQ